MGSKFPFIALLISCFLSLSVLPLKGQNSDLERETVRKITSHYQSIPIVKLFVHTDKTLYDIGETIWYKVYATLAPENRLSMSDEIVYLTILDQNGSEVISETKLLTQGTSHGQIELKGQLDPGYYKLVAYTNWMRNWDESYWYQKEIKIIDPLRKSEDEQVTGKIRIDFFPEGGDMIAGLRSRVAVKATNAAGTGMTTKGSIIDGNGELLTTFETNDLGFGEFSLTPGLDKYKVQINSGGTPLEFALPQARRIGYSLAINHHLKADHVLIEVKGAQSSLANSYVIAHQQGRIYFSARKETSDGDFIARINKELLPSGIVCLTFFDSSGIPRAERLLFANKYNFETEVDLNLDKPRYEKRSLVNLTLSLQDAQIDSLNNGTFSVAVLNTDRYPTKAHEQNIRNYLTLTSELNGRIERPGYYEEWTKQSYKDLDLLLLTQGWRRFRWDDILAGNNQPSYQIEDGITVSGTVVVDDRRSKARKGEITLSVLGDQYAVVKGETTEEGRFAFKGIKLEDSIDIFLQAKLIMGKKERLVENAYIEIDETKNDAPKFSPWESFKNDIHPNAEKEFKTFQLKKEEIRKAFQLDDSVVVLEEVAITGKKENNIPIYEPGNIYGTPTTRFEMDDYPSLKNFPNMFDVLRQVPRVRVLGSYPNQGVRIGGSGSIGGGMEPLFIIDGVYVDIKTFQDLNPRDIKKIDVLNGPDAAIYGAQGANGVIVAYTRGALGEFTYQNKKGTLMLKIAGLSKTKEFYTPDYTTKKAEHAKPDFRSTLYWQPEINTTNGQAEITFYTSDEDGIYQIEVQGISKDGTPIARTIQLKVY